MDLEVVLFDYGGVLVESPLDAARAYAAQQSVPADIGLELVFGGPRFPEHPWPRMERGELPFSSYGQAVAQLATGSAPGFQAPSLEVIYDLAPCSAVAAIVDMLNDRGIATGIATNNIREGRSYWHQDVNVQRFDYVFDSSLMGARKPEAAFFSHILGVLNGNGHCPEATMLIDDVPENVEAARAAGFVGVLVDGTCAEVAGTIRKAIDASLSSLS